MLFGVESTATPTTIIGAFIAVSMSLVALVGWIMRHVFMTTIPSIVEDSKQAREAAKAASDAERKLCAEQFNLINTSLVGLTTAMASNGSNIVNAVTEHTTKAMADYRHDIYDKINEAVLTREVHLARKAQEQKNKTPSSLEDKT